MLSEGGISELADDLYKNHKLAADLALSANATYAGAFLKASYAFAGYITEFQWENPQPNSDSNTTGKWKFKGWNGEWFYEDEILIYYSDPAYITIQNNSSVAIDITELKVGGVNTINTADSTGYGFVFADDDALQGDLPLITEETLKLSAGQPVRLMFPGGYGKSYEFSGTVLGTDPVELRRTGGPEEESVSETFSSLTGNMSAAGGTIDIKFGGSRPICRIVTDANITVKTGVVGENKISDEDGTEYAFASIQNAVTFAQNNSLKGSKVNPTAIEMCENYLIPGSDTAAIPESYHLQLTTAAGKGKYLFKHGEGDESRAAISRNSGNTNSFLTGTGDKDNPGSTSLKVKDIIFDGKNFPGWLI